MEIGGDQVNHVSSLSEYSEVATGSYWCSYAVMNMGESVPFSKVWYIIVLKRLGVIDINVLLPGLQ